MIALQEFQSGNRAEDLALRLKYAGFAGDVPIEHDTSAVLRAGIAATPTGGTLLDRKSTRLNSSHQ